MILLSSTLLAKDDGIPHDAVKWKKGWFRELKSGANNMYITEHWGLNKNRVSLLLQFAPLSAGIAYHENNKIRLLYQDCRVYDCEPDSCGGSERAYGKILEFNESGELKREHCESPDFAFYTSEGQTPGIELCGTEIEYNPDGTVKSKKEHRECTIPCGRFQPFIREGNYTLRANTRIRKSVGLNSPMIEVLQKGSSVKVVRDTKKIATIMGTTAPWVEVEYGNNKKGFIFGGLLEFLAMDTEGFDFATLLDMERIDKIPEYCFRATDSKGRPLHKIPQIKD